MPQNPIPVGSAKPPAGGVALNNLDASGNLLTKDAATPTAAALNITAAAVVSATAKRLRKVIIIAPGSTSGTFTLNDSKTTGAAAAANAVFVLPYNGANNIAGAVFDVDIPLTNGLVVSAVPGGGSPILALMYS